MSACLSQSWLGLAAGQLGATPAPQCPHSNHDPTTTGGCVSPTGDTLGAPLPGDQGASCSRTDPMGHHPHKATFFRQGDVADKPNTERQTQKVRPNEEIKEHLPHERTT